MTVLNVRFDTYLAHLIGGPTAIGAAGEHRLTHGHRVRPNVPVELQEERGMPKSLHQRLAGRITKPISRKFRS